MRASLPSAVLLALLVGCSSSSSSSPPASDAAAGDTGAEDAAAGDTSIDDDTTAADSAIAADSGVDALAPPDATFDATLNGTPFSVYCFDAGACDGGPEPVCCDVHGASGFTDTCVATAASCSGDAFECDDGLDCFDGVCCATTGFNSAGATILLGSRCTQLPETGCKGGVEQQLCSSAGDCSGNACMPVHASGRTVGVCQ